MLKIGIKKELMFFTRSFKMGGIIIAALVLAIASPLLMKLSGAMMSSLGSAISDNSEYGENYPEANVNVSVNGFSSGNLDYEDMLELFDTENLAVLGLISAFGDLTNTLLLIFMIVTMYSAGGELKKRSMIIPQNAGLSAGLYVLPKFLLYPTAAAVFAFAGMLVSGLTTAIAFSGAYETDTARLLLAALAAAVYDGFIAALYFTLGLCTARAGIATIILYGGSAILSVLFTSFGADKFHPFALRDVAQDILTGQEIDLVNLWGSVGVTALIILLCYFVTVFVISAKRIDNRGEEGIEL
ncbi:MAG: hypothetical protein NC394_04785 [Bacteroides sp.]|nr:hypothetical protein [Bacteroides sp.]